MKRRLTEALTRTGPVGSTVGTSIDLLGSAGLRYAWHRRQLERRMGALGAEPSIAVFSSIWRDAATEVGAEFAELPGGFFEMRRDGRASRAWWHVPMLDDWVTIQFALRKTLVHSLLVERGLPVPVYREFDRDKLAEPLALLENDERSWVIKPANGASGGAGVTSGVRSPPEFCRAVLRAARRGRRILMEREAPGDCYRLLFLDGELLDVVRRRPPHVVGDGRSTVEELVRAENARRIAAAGNAGLRLLHIDLDAVLTLARVGLTPSSVVPAGRAIAVKTVSNQNRAEDNETERDVSSAVVEQAAAAAAAIGLRLAGVDVVTPDIRGALADQGGAIIEVNGTPGLHYHYQVADRARATKVATPILQTMLLQGDRRAETPGRPKALS